LLRQLHRVATLWSSGVSEGHAMELQHVLTHFLLQALKLLASTLPTTFLPDTGEKSAGESSRLQDTKEHSASALLDALTENDTLLALMNGVSERLSSTNSKMRRDGMMIGQTLGQYVLNEPVVFDELQSWASAGAQSSSVSVQQSHQRGIYSRLDQINTSASFVSESTSSNTKPVSAVECSEADDSDDSDWDDQMYPQTRYDVVDDEEDLREVPQPLYLHDCLDLLRTSETADGALASHQAALQALPRLVRERPGDLADVGPLLAKQLVVMENKFYVDDFDSKLVAPLCALVAEEPLVVGHALIEDLFHDGSLYNRTLALTALNEGAWELSGNKRLRDSFVSGERILRCVPHFD
jgi:hypothetical protein